MLRALLLILIATLSFLGFLVVLAPASPLLGLVRDDLHRQVPELNILAVNGTIWDGNADLVYRRFPGSNLRWQIDPMPLIGGEAEGDLTLKGEAHEFRTHAQVSQNRGVVRNLEGFVDSDYINAVSMPQGLTFTGRIDVSALSIESDLRWVQAATGQINWPGGRIVSRLPGASAMVFDLPALEGDVGMQAENVSLNIHHDDQAVVDILVKPSGWIVVAVKARLFDLAGLPWPSGTSLDDTVLEFEEKLF